MPHVFGSIPGYPVGSTFANRSELAKTGVHPPTMNGISGRQSEGASSIVVSGGYEDDYDLGGVIIYTGEGARDPATGKQIADQHFRKGNRALAVSCDDGLPVRVIRGSRGDAAHSPTTGLRYDGLFSVRRYWHELGTAGFRVYRFELVSDREPTAPTPTPLPHGAETPGKVTTVVQRIVRSTPVANTVKALHDYQCQFCGTRILLPTGPYAEGAHVRPLGGVHAGPDQPNNVLCLCANCHVRFDRGAIHVSNSLEVVETASGTNLSQLRTVENHAISEAHLDYHRTHIAESATAVR